MGAIVAIIGEEGDPELPERLERMLARSPYRGAPKRHFEHGLALGIQTLGWDASLATVGNWTVAIHGFIGNWAELGPAHGWDFPDDADNATKLAIAYEHLENDLLGKLRGEFSILVYNRRTRDILAVRDVSGGQTLFHHSATTHCLLATEMGQLFAGGDRTVRADLNGIVQVLVQRHPDRERTHVRGVFKFVPGMLVRCKPEGTDYLGPIWMPPPEESGRYNFADLALELRRHIERAVMRSMPSRRFALALSGGVDSTTLWCLIHELASKGHYRATHGRPVSWTLGDHPNDESEVVRGTLRATGTQGMFIDLSSEPPFDVPPRFSQTIGTLHSSIVTSTERIARCLAADSRYVVLMGNGPDELFSGGPGVLKDLLVRGRLIRFALDLFSYRLPPGTSRMDFVRRYSTGPLLQRVFPAPSRRSNPPWICSQTVPPQCGRVQSLEDMDDSPFGQSRIELLRRLQYLQDTPDYDTLRQVLSMHQIERRCPYMDLDILDFAFRIPGRAHAHGVRAKEILRHAAGDSIPQGVRAASPARLFIIRAQSELDRLRADKPPLSWALVKIGIVDHEGLCELIRDGYNDAHSALTVFRLAVTDDFVQQHSL